MSYAGQSNTPRPAAALGALAVPLGFGVLLVTGLAVTGGLPEVEETLTGFQVKPEPRVIPPPPPEPVEQVQETGPVQPTTATPDFIIPKPDVSFDQSPSIPVDIFDGIETDLTPIILPEGIGEVGRPPAPEPSPAADPISAVPRGNPGRWVTNGDYRTRWINEGLSGIAGFSLEIDRNGRVSDCTITRSTGHSVLDGATCRLLERRARFTPARNGAGDNVAGTYSSSVSWEIP